MRIKSLVRFAALLAVAALAIPALAKPISKSINLVRPAKIGTTHLAVGAYRLLIDGNRITVQRGKQAVAQAVGRWEQRTPKAQYDSVVLGPDGELLEIRFAGNDRVLVISNPR